MWRKANNTYRIFSVVDGRRTRRPSSNPQRKNRMTASVSRNSFNTSIVHIDFRYILSDNFSGEVR